MTSQIICKLDDIIPEAGVCALVDGKQVAVFRTKDDQLFAIDNFDPFSKANVLSRGLIGGTVMKTESETGDIKEQEVIYVASPIYKQRFDLATGHCLDDDEVKLNHYTVSLEDDTVVISIQTDAVA